MQSQITSLLVVFAAIAAAPLLVELARGVILPLVVVEIALGIVVGPEVLDLVEDGPLVELFSDMGLAMLFFLAGMEIDLAAARGRAQRLAAAGWGASVAIALGVAALLGAAGLVTSTVPVAIALSTTALGTLMPILRDAGELRTPFGGYVIAAGTVGEFGPIVLISLFMTAVHGTLVAALSLLVFGAVAIGAAFVATRVRHPRVLGAIERTMHATGQLGVRLSLLVLIFLLWVVSEFDLELALGAFAAGLVVGLVTKQESAEPVRVRLEGIGFGMFVPFFFVASGVTFDLDALLSSGEALLLLPVFAALFLLVRGVPALLARRDLDRRSLGALALCSATALPLVVAITGIAVGAGEMTAAIAASLVGAGMLSVLTFPALALVLRRRTTA